MSDRETFVSNWLEKNSADALRKVLTSDKAKASGITVLTPEGSRLVAGWMRSEYFGEILSLLGIELRDEIERAVLEVVQISGPEFKRGEDSMLGTNAHGALVFTPNSA